MTADVATAGAVVLLGVALYGLLTARNLIRILIALQIGGKGAMLAVVAAGLASGQAALGQTLAITVIAADTVVAVVGLALVIQIRRRLGTLDIGALPRLRG